MLLSYCCVEWYAALWLEPESAAAAHMFGFLWAVALTGVSLALPRWIGKVVYGLSFYFFAIFAAVQSGYYAVFGRMMWLGDLRTPERAARLCTTCCGAFPRSGGLPRWL